MTAGRRSIPPGKIERASSYPASSGAITRPFRSARSREIEIVEVGAGEDCTINSFVTEFGLDGGQFRSCNI